MGLMMRGMVAGILSTAVLLVALALSVEFGISELRSLKRTLFFSFITFAGSAELGKFVVYRYIIIRNTPTISPIDAIILSVSTALGFSSAALLFFLLDFFSIQQSLPVTLFSLAIIPANLVFSVVMGFFVGMARFLKTHIVFSLTGLFGAVFFHGIFMFCMVTQDFKLLSLFSLGSAVIVFILAMKAAFTVPETSK